MQIELDILESLGLAIIAYLIGVFIKGKFDFFRKFFIPSPVIGGLVISILVFVAKESFSYEFTFDNILQDFFMNIFFAAIGLSCSFKSLKKLDF